jgi:hypothetical protein
MMMEAPSSSETSAITRVTQCNLLEDRILHSHRRENFKSYKTLTGWTPERRRNVSPVKYELGVYIPEDGILHSHRRENLKSYKALLCLQFFLSPQTWPNFLTALPYSS